MVSMPLVNVAVDGESALTKEGQRVQFVDEEIFDAQRGENNLLRLSTRARVYRLLGSIAEGIREHDVDLADVGLKLNDALRSVPYQDLKAMLEEHGLQDIQFFADLKLSDVGATDIHELSRLVEHGIQPACVTMTAAAGTSQIRKAREFLDKVGWGDTKILAISVLTDQDEKDAIDLFNASRRTTVLQNASQALAAGADGIVCGAVEGRLIREVFGLKYPNIEIVTPGVRLDVGDAKGDGQNADISLTPGQSKTNGATSVVSGSDVHSRPGKSPAAQLALIVGQLKSADEFVPSGQYEKERLFYTGEWSEILTYLEAMMIVDAKTHAFKLRSGLKSNLYVNVGVLERYPELLERAARELHEKLASGNRYVEPKLEKEDTIDAVIGAQMGSVRMSDHLAKTFPGAVSIYTEKDGEAMAFKRHEVDLVGKTVILSEDVITRATTAKKIIDLARSKGANVKAITCLVNRSGESSIDGVPIVSMYTPEDQEMYWDGSTPESERENATHGQLPSTAQIFTDPKGQWSEVKAAAVNH